jgi:hypothetical protein
MTISNPTLTRRGLLIFLGAAASTSFHRAFARTSPRRPDDMPGASSTLFYKPETTGALWDTWLYHRNDTFYLYSLSGAPGAWSSVAIATSRDGTHWQEHGTALQGAADATWLGSGAVWPVAAAGGAEKFIMNFSEWRGSNRAGRQTIFFAESRDLIHWTRLGPEYEFGQDPRWYEPQGRWDNIWALPRPGGGFYGYWAAQAKGKIGLGFGESADGIRWRALEPPLVQGTSLSPGGMLSALEVSAVHEWRGKYYALVGLNDLQAQIDEDLAPASFRPGHTTLIADSPFGPFRPAPKNRRLLVGNASYFARFDETPDGLLVNHHSWEIDLNLYLGVKPSETYMAPLKRAEWDEEGTLRLKWWQGNERAKGAPVDIALAKSRTPSIVTLLNPAFDPNRSLIVEGVVSLPASEAPTGLYLQGSGENGTAFLVGTNGAVEYGSMRNDGTQFQKKGRVDRELQLRDSARFRLVRKKCLTELYLNDYLMQCYSLPEIGTGRLGLLGPASAFRELSAWHAA